MRNGQRLKRLLFLAIACMMISGVSFAESWKFGVMADTQWTTSDPAGQNPNGVSVSIIQQINRQFIARGVKFVIQVGDLTEDGNDFEIATRAAAAQQLYDAGIGFFPMRGNHETYANPANQFAIPAFQSNFPQTRGLIDFGANNFSSPTLVSPDLNGMSYSFDYGTSGNNARFLMLDTWAMPSKIVSPGNGYNYGYSIADQQSWINERLNQASRGTEHTFVFSHQNLIGENHQDSIFTGYTDANTDMQNTFFASLQKNGTRYYISGHDHIHQRSIITSPNGAYKVQELICASNSSKFYTPKSLTDAKWYGQKRAETSISQEKYTVGFYIFTIDGPQVTVDYYSDDRGNWQSDGSYPEGPAGAGSNVTPTFNFVRKETWGYSLNGHDFLISQGESYEKIEDSFETTVARILSGKNSSSATDHNARPLTKSINTGWTDANTWRANGFFRGCKKTSFNFASNILDLSGMADLGTEQTDVFVLSMTYEGAPVNFRAGFGIASIDDSGNWINAVDRNIGKSMRKFVSGPWQAQYGLGTYGVDQKNKTAWAVINYNGSFAVGLLNK